jgi:hypothetical protein
MQGVKDFSYTIAITTGMSGQRGCKHMFQELLIAILKAGLPVGLASYALAWWAIKRNYLGEVNTIKDLEAGIKKQKKDKKNKNSSEESKQPGDPLHNKWLAFGGGFYGVVGLLTYARVELGEIRDFVMQFEGFWALISGVSLDMFIDLLIEGIMNFVIAIAWPMYWISEIRSDRIWIWFAVAYGAYWAGTRLALHLKK